VLTAKLCRLLKQAVPVLMPVMQVIDETNNAGALFRSDEPIYGNSADEQNWPPMNTDERRLWNEKAVLIGVHLRSSAAKILAFRIQLKACKQMVNTSRPASRT
jgi:hypothetical protein